MLCKGIFWIIGGCLVPLKAACDKNGALSEPIPPGMLSKSGKNFNHKNAWETLPKAVTGGKAYNYYPRGRVEIKNARVTVYANLYTEEIQKKIIEEFQLLTENGIKKVDFKTDQSAHYMYYSTK